MYRPLWIEVNLKNLERNVNLIRKAVGNGIGILATVKQNAYGHGLVPVARRLSSLNVDFFGIGSLEEAAVLRGEGIKEPLLVLTAFLPQDVEEIVNLRVRATVADIEGAKALDKAARQKSVVAPVHIKVDTGMGRVGVWHEDAEKFVLEVKNFKNLYVEGIFTHFPAADTDARFTKRQIQWFNRLLEKLRGHGICFKYVHCASSVALARYREARFNMVRPGLILYGVKPHRSVSLDLTPVLSLKAKVIFFKNVERGRSIGYGRTYIAGKAASVATVAAGYADGYPWSASNTARVIVNDKLFKVRGRVCMDHIMVETDSSVKKGDTVTLIGKEKHVAITAEDMARWSRTIPYEIVSRLSLNIPRIYK